MPQDATLCKQTQINLTRHEPSYKQLEVKYKSMFFSLYFREKVLVQKTFHRYVVRAKRGTAQSRKDGQGNAPKSAGATLRRYNEAALKEVR